MSSELEKEVYSQLRASQDKYVYFMLAAAGAAIGLAINQTQDMTITWSQIPLALAVLCWGLSFLFGSLHLAYVNSILFANFELLRVQEGKHPLAGDHPEVIAAASQGIREAIESNNNKASRLGHLQFSSLVLGAISYIIWHIVEMYLRSIP